ncbi:Putative serine protease HtrA [Anatilimnocola aggregata]|uniref:Serine protease HtrA n=1 Tax=Anatilimnocola aggregata TaxID=2528021 RepID=A0A517YCW8_9BACT|nr:S1C family serine protease [Anatilimnocola aggregata]QDU28084.1 Putative serine protease HtrA [Anatilimnocola aggregata]
MKYLPACILLIVAAFFAPLANAQTSLATVITDVQPRMVKLYGAGGVQGLEAYQSGFVISDEGHILTVWSYVLDADVITATLDDGRKLPAEVVGMDPRLEIAVLKIDAQDLAHFNLDEAVSIEPGQRVLAFSNLYGVAAGNEPTSVLRGIVSAKSDLAARRGAFETNYRGKVYVVDAMTNNPGAAGGALTDRKGRLAGLLGKELRNSQTNTWLNYAIPVSELVQAVVDIRAGKLRSATRDETVKKPKDAHTLAALGVQLVPDFLPKTPPFVESVRPMSPAAKAGIRADDLILFVNEQLAPSHKQVVEELTFIDRVDGVRLTIQRGQELVEVQLSLEP